MLLDGQGDRGDAKPDQLQSERQNARNALSEEPYHVLCRVDTVPALLVYAESL